MANLEVVPTTSVEAGQWLRDAVTDFGGHVEQLVPAGYARCIRIFHRPDQGDPDDDAARSWAEVAARHGITLHPAAQWISLTGGRDDSPHHDGPGAPSDQPLYGSLDQNVLPLLCDLLARHTRTPERCHAALWEGGGATPRSWNAYPKLELPGRRHWMFAPIPVRAVPAMSATLEVAGYEEDGRSDGTSWLHVGSSSDRRPDDRQLGAEAARWKREGGLVQSPTWWWPEDRAWVVHSDTDLESTLVGCSADLAAALLDHPDIECLEVQPTTSLEFDGDRVNRTYPRA